jgi:dehydrogenase/reductase SDR family protein 12
VIDLSRTLDTLLDRTIAPGYGSLGLLARRHLPDWPADPPRIDGQVVLVTGAASGLGLAACVGFARLGASVLVLARSQARADEAAANVTAEVPGADVRGVVCDVSDLDALAGFAGRFTEQEPRLDVLVNNAGVMPDQRRRSVDGHELMFATHVLGPFVLTGLLAPLLERSAPARVINVSSGGMYSQALPEDDLESDSAEYNPKRLYARTKRELVVITEQWARRLDGTGVVVHSMHPGWADTEGIRRWMPAFRAAVRPIIRTPAQGADTIVWLGAAPEPLRCTGRFWHDRRPRPTHYLIGPGESSPEAGRRLWDQCQAALDRVKTSGARSASTPGSR